MPHPQPPTVLVAEGQAKSLCELTGCLAREGFDVLAARDGRRALELFDSQRPGVVVLDLTLFPLDHVRVRQQIGRRPDVPVLYLMTCHEVWNRLPGVRRAGDDFVVRPLRPREVVARVRGALGRRREAKPTGPSELAHGPLFVDRERRRVLLRGAPVSLTRLEYALLTTLMDSPGRVFLRDELISRIYPHGEVVIDRVIDVHIGKLRQKLERRPASPELILTVRGVGYRFADALETIRTLA